MKDASNSRDNSPVVNVEDENREAESDLKDMGLEREVEQYVIDILPSKTWLSLMSYKLVYSRVNFFFKTLGTTYVELKKHFDDTNKQSQFVGKILE